MAVRFTDITLEGSTFQVPVDGFASEDTLRELVDAIGSSKGNKGRADPSGTGSVSGSIKKTGKAADKVSKSFVKMHPAVSALETGFNILGDTLTGATGLVKSIAQADGSFGSLNAVVDFSVGQITRFTSMVPILGGFLTAASETTGELTKLRLAFMDLQFESFNRLGQAGFRLSSDLGKTLETVLAANISLDQFNNIVATNNDGLRIFGGSINNAATEFSSRLERLTDQSSPVGLGFRMLGMDASDIADEFADFVESNRFNRRLMTGSEQQLNAAMLERATNERRLAELTGQTVQEQKSEFMRKATTSAFQAAIMGEEFQMELNQFASTLTGFNSDLGGIFEARAANFPLVDEAQARLIGLIPGLSEAIDESLANIKTGGDVVEETAKIQMLLADFAKTDRAKQLVQLGMLDTGFMGIGELFLTGVATTTQLENINQSLATQAEAAGQVAPVFDNIVEAQAAFNEQFKTQIEHAEQLAKNGELSVKALEQLGLDATTIGIVLGKVKVEDAVGTFQSQLLRVSTAAGPLVDILIDVTEGFDKLLRKIDPDFERRERISKIETMAEEQGLGTINLSSANPANQVITTTDEAGRAMFFNKKDQEFQYQGGNTVPDDMDNLRAFNLQKRGKGEFVDPNTGRPVMSGEMLEAMNKMVALQQEMLDKEKEIAKNTQGPARSF